MNVSNLVGILNPDKENIKLAKHCSRVNCIEEHARVQYACLLSSSGTPRLSCNRATMYADEKQYREKSSSDLLGYYSLRVYKSWLQNCSPASAKSDSDEDFLSPKN